MAKAADKKGRVVGTSKAVEEKTSVGKITENKHPRYDFWLPQWEFFELSYVGGQDYISKYLFKYFKEGEDEYKQRKERSYRENHTRRVVDLMNTYLFKEDATRKTENEYAQKFIDNFDGKGRHAAIFMKVASIWASVMGRVYIVVDKKKLPEEEQTGTQADNLKEMPYCYLVFPKDVKDIAFDETGRIKWALIRETRRNDDDPFSASKTIDEYYRLWEKNGWSLFDKDGNKIEEGETRLNAVPIVALDNEEQEAIAGQSLIADVANIDRAIFNNWSRLDTIVCEQTFSQLIFPVEGLPQDIVEDDELRKQFLSLAVNRIILYSTQAQTPPAFISPDASQAEFILTMIQTQIKQLFAALGLQGEVGSEVNVQSGVAKAYDFDKVNKLLNSKAGNLQQAEVLIYEIFSKWLGDIQAEVEVTYPTEFDVKSLVDDIEIAERLALLDVSETFTKEIHKQIVLKALPDADEDTILKINKEIDERVKPEADLFKTNIFPFDKEKKKEGEEEDGEE